MLPALGLIAAVVLLLCKRSDMKQEKEFRNMTYAEWEKDYKKNPRKYRKYK